MLVRVDPEDLLAAGHRMADDGPTLRALATLVGRCASAGTQTSAGAPALVAALSALAERGSAALAALAAAADTLARGLADSGRRYGDVEDRLAVMGRAVVG